jgi:hypothetical protein
MPHLPWSAAAWGRGFNSAAAGAMRRRLPGGGDRGGHKRKNFSSAKSTAEGSRGGGAGGAGGGKDGAAPGSAHPGGMLSRTLASYTALNTTHPTATKVCTSAVILIFGDATAQKLQHFQGDDARAPFALDWRRLGAFASFGAVYTGWFQMHWFHVLTGWFPRPVAAVGAAAASPSFFSKPVLGREGTLIFVTRIVYHRKPYATQHEASTTVAAVLLSNATTE